MMSAGRRERIAEFERVCRARGLPITTQRKTVFALLIGRTDHPTADQVYDQVRGYISTISRTSVYRILDTLVELGLITKVCHPGSAARFDPKTARHHHLVCLYCERIIDLEEQRLDNLVWPDVRGHGFQIHDYHIHFQGICAECGRKHEGGAPARRAPRAGRCGRPAAVKSRGQGRRRRT